MHHYVYKVHLHLPCLACAWSDLALQSPLDVQQARTIFQPDGLGQAWNRSQEVTGAILASHTPNECANYDQIYASDYADL